MVPGANAASIMDRLRVKQYRPWNDISRLLRQLAGEKHLFVDAEERGQLQRCLDLLQKSIKINSAQGMIERLDTITRQLGLKLTKDQKRSAERKPVELFEVFISSDMFYVEVVVESNGHVCDVKVAHHGDPVSCPELCRVLQENDFVTFTAHLEGLIAIYQLNCEKSRKQKAYVALQALESDLSTVAGLQKFLNDPRQLVCKSPVGILQKRRGGFPMQLTFFVSPYDLIDQTKSTGPGSGSMTPFTVENVLNQKLGQSVSISIENSGQHKLQTGSLITNSDGKMPNFGPLTQLNSVSLPACFTMKLATPMPLDNECIKKIQKVTGIEIPGSQATSPLIELITKRKQGAYFVKLPDQDHTYHMNGGQRRGSVISSIPFTHPTHVPPVLEFLRQQSLFNALISSCVRDLPSAAPQSHVFEVQASSLTSLCVSFEHPLDNESLVTLEISLVDILGLKCKAYFCSQQSELNQFLNEDTAAKVLQLSFSIPVLMRSILKKAKGGSSKPLEELQSKPVATPSFLPGGPSGDTIKRDHFDGENVPNFGDTNGPGSMQQDLFDLENIGGLQGGLSLTMLADDGPTSLGVGRQNPFQQQSVGAANGSGGPGPQLQRKRPREDGDFLDNRPPGLPLRAAGGPTTKGQLDNINNNSGDNQQGGQQPQQAQLQQSSMKSVGDQLGTQIKRQRTDGPMEDGGISVTATGGLNNVRDSKNLRAGGDSGESPPAKTSIPPHVTSGGSGSTSGGGGSSSSGGTTSSSGNGGNGSGGGGGSAGGSSSSHGVGSSSASGSQQQQSASRKEKSSSSSSSGGTSSKSDDKRNSSGSSSSSSSRDKEKRKDKDKSYSKDGSSKSSSSKSSSKDKEHKTSSKSSSSKDKDKEKDRSSSSGNCGSSRGSSSSGSNAIGDKVQQSGGPMAKFSSSEMGTGSNASPSKYGSSTSSSSTSEGQQFTVKSSSSAQGIKLTINKARTSESGGGSSSRSGGSSSTSSSSGTGGSGGGGGGGSSGNGSGSGSSKTSFSASSSSSSSSSSSKHNRDSPKPRSLSSSPSHKTKVSPSWKSSPKHSSSSSGSSSGGGGAGGGSTSGGSGGSGGPSSAMMIMPPPADVIGNSSVDLVEQRLRALHGDDSPVLTTPGFGGAGGPVGGTPAGTGSPFDSRSPIGTMGPPSGGSSSLSSVSRPSPVVIDDELMDEALCGMKNHV